MRRQLSDTPDFGPVAPVLCVGVTGYKGIEELGAKPGDWVAISGIGGLDHMAVQYAKAMGPHVVAVDVHQDKLDLATSSGLTQHSTQSNRILSGTFRARWAGSTAFWQKLSNSASSQAVGMLRRGGFMSLVGLPPGDFPLPIFDILLNRLTIHGSIVGTRNDLAESLAFAGESKVTTHFTWDSLENTNAIFDRMRTGSIDGCVVLKI